jgi:hypothetical protein
MVIRTVGVKEFASKVAARDQARATTRQGHAQSVLATVERPKGCQAIKHLRAGSTRSWPIAG